MAIIEPTVDHIDDETLMRELRNLAGAVDKNETALNNEMAQISQRQDQVDESIAGFQSQIDANKSAIENEVVARQNADESEAEARQQADITGASLSIVSGAIQLMLNRALGAINANVTAPFIKTMELIPTATERAFKLRITYWDNTQYDTNDFVIPAGGGTDVSVTGVTIQDGTTPNSFQVQIELSDGTPISSNDYPFPEAVVNPYPTSLTLRLSGTTLNVSIGLSNSNSVSNTVDLAPLLLGYATQQWVTTALGDYATDDEVNAIGITTAGNVATVNGKTANIINSVSGQVTDGNLKITINGVESGDIPLPKTDFINDAFILPASGNSRLSAEINAVCPSFTIVNNEVVESQFIQTENAYVNINSVSGGTASFLHLKGNGNSSQIVDIHNIVTANSLAKRLSSPLTIPITRKTFPIPYQNLGGYLSALEDGNYIYHVFQVDIYVVMGTLGTTMNLFANESNPDNLPILNITKSGKSVTINSESITLDERFMTSSSATDFTPSRVYIPLFIDMFEKA